MLILHDENLLITGIQTFPETTKSTHIVADDLLRDQVAAVIGYARLVDNNGTLELPSDLEGLAAERANIELSDSIRAERDSKLSELDKIVSNPLRYNELSQKTKDDLAAYRQALLDVPQQEGFPSSVDWPIMPSI